MAMAASAAQPPERGTPKRARFRALPRRDDAEPVRAPRPVRRDASPFTTIEAQFQALSDAGALDATTLGRDDNQPVPLTVLRTMLLHPSVTWDERDRILDVVLTRARQQPDPWLLGVAGLLLPGLRSVRDRIEGTPSFAALRHPDFQNELQVELLTALMEAARNRGPGCPKVAHELLRAAAAAGRAFARAELADREHSNLDDVADESAPTPGQTALDILRDAVDAGVLHPDDAWLIVASRLDEQPLPDLADQLGLPYNTIRRRRERAEARLRAWVRGDAAPTHDAAMGGRPRHPHNDATADHQT